MPDTTTTADSAGFAAALALCAPLSTRQISDRGDVLVGELLTAVLAAVPADNPCRPALQALPRPMPYMNPGTGFGRRGLVARALQEWLPPRVKDQADGDPACAEAMATFSDLDLRLLDERSIEAAQKWAGECARILPANQRALAFHVSLATQSLLGENDAALVRATADALIAARGTMEFLLIREVCDIVHSLGFTDRLN